MVNKVFLYGREKQVAGDFWDELIVKAKDAKDKSETLIFGLDTSWLPAQSSIASSATPLAAFRGRLRSIP